MDNFITKINGFLSQSFIATLVLYFIILYLEKKTLPAWFFIGIGKDRTEQEKKQTEQAARHEQNELDKLRIKEQEQQVHSEQMG